MNVFTALTFLLMAFTQKVSCRRLEDNINNAVNHKPYSTVYETDPLYHTWGFAGHSTASDDLYPDRIIYPDEDRSKIITPSRQPKRECVSLCRPNFEYHPVCGTDGNTYYNRDQLECYMRCGVDVRIQDLSPCPGWENTSPSTLASSTSSTLKSCISSCPTTPEYNPVCGTDNVTYSNHGKLTCAQFCGKDVQLQRRSPCPKISPKSDILSITFRTTTISGESRACIASCPSTSEYKPVCGTNGETYLNLSRLQCARFCGVDVSLLKVVACHVEVTSNPNELS